MRAPEAADGVADGDGAAVDVDLAHVEVQLTGDGDGLRGEGFVGLDEVDVLDGHAGLGHGLTGGGNGADAHDLGIDAALAPADELRHGLEAILLDGLAGGENDGGSAVVDAGGVAGGHALNVLAGIRLMDLGGLEGVDDLVLNALGTDGERALAAWQGPRAVEPARGNSSFLNSTISFLTLTGTGTISSSKRPEACAASVFCWEAAPKASSSSRVMPQTSQMFSAVVPMW